MGGRGELARNQPRDPRRRRWRVNPDRDDANEEERCRGRGGGGKLISGLKRDAPVMLHRY